MLLVAVDWPMSLLLINNPGATVLAVPLTEMPRPTLKILLLVTVKLAIVAVAPVVRVTEFTVEGAAIWLEVDALPDATMP